MNTIKTSKLEQQQQQNISNYYQFQSKIYDLTRWSFLFGRLKVLRHISFSKKDAFKLAEIGCGTGFNLEYLTQKYINIEVVGVDVSKDMMAIAQNKMLHYPNTKVFYQEPYTVKSVFLKPHAPDIILFSYTLTMINPQWKNLIYKAYEDLPSGGKIIVVDFHNSKFSFFKKHMGNHHVRMDGHILAELKALHFKFQKSSVHNAYLGLWEYFLFIGEKP